MKFGTFTLLIVCLSTSGFAAASPEGPTVAAASEAQYGLPVGNGAMELGLHLAAKVDPSLPLATVAAPKTAGAEPTDFLASTLRSMDRPVVFGFVALGLLIGSVLFRHVRRV
ncbi:MAG: hypothetical protein ACFBZ8_09165 [Opitutales bacterium]